MYQHGERALFVSGAKTLACLFVCVVLFLILSPCSAAEWQKKYNVTQVRQHFEEPPLWYAPHTFWFWDAPLDPAQAAEMAHEMTTQRLNPGYAHPRHSGSIESPFPFLPHEQWLSPLWFESFSAALKKAETAGMTLGYCDEYWWPSGQAAGRVLEMDSTLKATSLEWTRQEIQGPGKVQCEPSKFTVAGRLTERNHLLASTLKVIGQGSAFEWTVPEGKWIIYSYNLYHHPGVDGGKVNYLDSRLMDTFIPIAHEPYDNNFPNAMGKTIPGVFVDNEGDYGWKMAWSDYLAERYQELKHRDIRLWLPLLTEKDEQGLWAKARCDWFDVVSDVYSNQFLGRLSNWLQDRGMYTISNLWEESIMLQTRAVGDFMRAQRSVSMPGNDCLIMKSQDVHDFKETQSVCEFEDRPFMSELMGVAGWEQTPVQMKQTLNGVTAWGVTHTVPHGINMNRKLETIPYPADWFTENPYWRYMHLWTDFARRASFVNRQGHLIADILLINPLKSAWALSEGFFKGKDGNDWPEVVVEINNTYSKAMKVLSDSMLDYLVADDFYMAKSIVQKSSDPPAQLRIGKHIFSVIVLPPMYIISQTTAQKILDFALAGGPVILLGDVPQGSPEFGMPDAVVQDAMTQLKKCKSVIDLTDNENKMASLIKQIKGTIEPQITMLTGDLPLFFSHRKNGQDDFYWLANKTNRKQTCTLAFREGTGLAEIWDCENGDIRPIYYKKQNNTSIVQIDFQPYQAFWLVFDANKPAIKKKQRIKKPEQIPLAGPWHVSFPETDTIKVSSAKSFFQEDSDSNTAFLQPQYDDSQWAWQNMVGPFQLIDTWKAFVLYIPEPQSTRYYRYKFTLKDVPEGALLNINADNEVQFWLNGAPVEPGPNAKNLTGADLHDIAHLLREGDNLLAVRVKNNPGFGTLIVQGTVQLINGDLFEIRTGENWKESNIEKPGWQQIDFNDASWQNAVVAPPNIEKDSKGSMKNPKKVVFKQSDLLLRLNIPPAAKSVELPELSTKAKIFVDGKTSVVKENKMSLPEKNRVLAIKVRAGENGLSSPAIFYCEGSDKRELGSWLDMGLRRFTGFVDYETQFNVPKGVDDAVLDLGHVLHMAEVWVNDKNVGKRLWPPFTFSLKNTIQPGKNKLRIQVGNLMVNEMGLQDDIGQLRHWGWHGAPADSCFDAGLFGPVKLFLEK